MICTLFGHSDYSNYTPYLKRIRSIIVDLIENKGVTAFYSGGRGNFDCICRDIIYGLKSLYPHIRNYLVLSYHPKPKDREHAKQYDGSLYLLEHRGRCVLLYQKRTGS